MKQNLSDNKQRVSFLRKMCKISQEELGYHLSWYNKYRKELKDDDGYVNWEIIETYYKNNDTGIIAYKKSITGSSQKSLVWKIENQKLKLDTYLDALSWFFTRTLKNNPSKPSDFVFELDIQDPSKIIRIGNNNGTKKFDKETRTKKTYYLDDNQVRMVKMEEPIFPDYISGKIPYINNISCSVSTNPETSKDISKKYIYSLIDLINTYGYSSNTDSYSILDTSTNSGEINQDYIIDLINGQINNQVQNTQNLSIQICKGYKCIHINHDELNNIIEDIFKYSLFRLDRVIDSKFS